MISTKRAKYFPKIKLDYLCFHVWSPARCIAHGGEQFTLHIAAAVGLYSNEAYPNVFRPLYHLFEIARPSGLIFRRRAALSSLTLSQGIALGLPPCPEPKPLRVRIQLFQRDGMRWQQLPCCNSSEALCGNCEMWTSQLPPASCRLFHAIVLRSLALRRVSS